MSPHPPPNSPEGTTPAPACNADAPHPTDAQYYRAILHALLDIGMDTARLAHEQAQAHAANPATAPDPTIPFDRISRAIRRTVALAQSVSEPQTAPATAPAATPAPPRPADTPTPAALRRQIRRGVEDRIARVAEGPRAETLRAGLRDRLDTPDDDDDGLLGLPIDMAIARVVDDLCASLPHPPGPAPDRVLRDGRRLRTRPTRCPTPTRPAPIRWPPPALRPPARPRPPPSLAHLSDETLLTLERARP